MALSCLYVYCVICDMQLELPMRQNGSAQQRTTIAKMALTIDTEVMNKWIDDDGL